MFKSDRMRIPENADWNAPDNESSGENEKSVPQIAVK
jgi:hypothetical protein